jgi:hypothetical protein
MLVAMDAAGQRVEARRDLSTASWHCPLCEGGTILKKGSRKIAHFAHVARLDCPLSGEGEEHLRIKFALVSHLRAHGWACDPEIALDPTRIVDVLATRPDDGLRMALEIQASSISIEEIDRRIEVDRSYGIQTGWLFTAGRLGSRWQAFEKAWQENVAPVVLRLPIEIISLHRRYRAGIFVALPPSSVGGGQPDVRIVRLELATAWADPSPSPIWYPPHRLSSIFKVTGLARLTDVTLATASGNRWHDDTVIFSGPEREVAPGTGIG